MIEDDEDNYFKKKREDKFDIKSFYAESEAEESFTPYTQYTAEELKIRFNYEKNEDNDEDNDEDNEENNENDEENELYNDEFTSFYSEVDSDELPF